MSRSSFDEQWEENVYCQGQQLNRWPSEFVVTGAYRYLAGLGASDRELLALDLGCGAGNNSVFLAKCGFKVLGVDGSETALKSARTLADQEGCEIKFVRGDFLNDEIWNDQEYDLVIDRAALTHNTRSVIKRTVAKVAQALRPGGWFVSELFSRDHSDVQFGLDGDDGSYKSFSGGRFLRIGAILMRYSQSILI